MKTSTLPNHPLTQRSKIGIRRRAGVWAILSAASLALLFTGALLAQSDNFNDGNDNGWTEYDPISTYPGLPPIATYSFPNGAYRIQTTPSPLPQLPPNGVGPGRAGSLRMDVSYTSFFITVDVVNWDPTLNQSFGIFARVQDVGLGTTDGYALTWNWDGKDIDITRVQNEMPAQNLSVISGSDAVDFTPGKSYRMVFIGNGPQLTARVYELPNTATPVAEITCSDTIYTSGVAGLLVYDNSGANHTTDATFDNYVALKEEPPVLSYQHFPGTEELLLSWPDSFTGYVLESSPVLPATSWTPEDVLNDLGLYFHWEGTTTGNKYFRLNKP
jgi:hypothetical protein